MSEKKQPSSKEQTTAPKVAPTEKKKYDQPFKQKGGTYFHCAEIVGRKNVFVTDEYINLLVTGFKKTELQRDIKNIGYVIMPNFFFWMFKLSATQDDPVAITSEFKRQAAVDIIEHLRLECKDKCYEISQVFRGNERVQRSHPGQILKAFQEKAKELEGSGQHKVWTPKTRLYPVNGEKRFTECLESLKKAPVSDRWKLVAEADKYPYLYIAEDAISLPAPTMSAATIVYEKVAA